jgi:hypothetical protein
MTIVICPGYHPPELTIDFLKGLGRTPARSLSGASFLSQEIIYPADRYPPYSSLYLLTFLRQQLRIRQPDKDKVDPKLHPLLWIGFSAGVVAAIGAAHLWQAAGGTVKAVIAIDGWGVPLWGNFPIHRVSHDAFTHWSSALLGGGEDSFYADPTVQHLDLWRSPQQIWGYYIKSSQSKLSASQKLPNQYQRITASELLNCWLCQYDEGKIT